MAQTLAISEPGPGFSTKNIHLLQHDVPNPGVGQVLVKMLAAPINPLDLLVLQNKYPVKPQSREQALQIPGYDGMGCVVKCDPSVTELVTGDHVIIKRHGLGTWRTHGLFSSLDVMKIPKDLEPEAASILRMGILTAYLLFEKNSNHVRPGDWIILNAATGVIAHFLVQFAHRKGVRVISVIRDRSDASKTKKILRTHGSDIVLEESELASSSELEGKKIMLALDAVFSTEGMRLIDNLSVGATYVSYGFLSGMSSSSGIRIAQEHLFQRNITFKGFRFSNAFSTLTDNEQSGLCLWLSAMLKRQELKMPLLDCVRWDSELVDEQALRQVVTKAQKADVGQRKIIIVFG